MSRYLGPDFDRFLKDLLPELGLDWRRHRRRGVRRKTAERLRVLSVRSLDDYRGILAADPLEKSRFLALLGVTISRFFREWTVFRFLAESVWPEWAGRGKVVMLSAGCACGEEPYSLAMLWRECGPAGVRPVILAMDLDAGSLERARGGLYTDGGLREVPPDMKKRYFSSEAGLWRLAPDVMAMVSFYRADFRTLGLPADLDVLLCRNMAFTYFDREGRRLAARILSGAIKPGGVLVVGAKEKPDSLERFDRIHPCVYRRPNA